MQNTTKLIAFIVCGLLMLTAIASYAANKPIPENQAFKLHVSKTNTDSLIAKWQLAPGYYLYRDRFKFKIIKPKDVNLGRVFMPKGIEKEDKILGKHQVYKGNLQLSLPLLNPNEKTVQLEIKYQGCAESGFCYPPITKEVHYNPVATLADNSIQIKTVATTILPNTPKLVPQKPLSQQEQAQNILGKDNLIWSFMLFFGFGLLLAFTPCVLPMIPILSGIIVGQGDSLTTRKAFSLSLTYVISMSITFAIAGVIVGLAGQNIQAAMQNPIVISIFSLVFVFLALSLFGFYELRLPNHWQQKITQLSNQQRAGNFLGVAIMGVLATLIVSPCVSAPLVGALAFIGQTGNAVLGGAALFAMGLGMGVPLLIIGTSFGRWLPKSGTWMDTVKTIFGVALLAMAIWLLQRIIPGPLALFLWASLAVIVAIYMGALARTPATGWGKLWQGLGIILLCYGILMIIGAAMGSKNPWQPLAVVQQYYTGTKAEQQGLKFDRVKSITDVKQAIKIAKSQHRPVMLDFYADWCVACKEMEATTFKSKKVKTALKNTLLLQADVTANDATDKTLERYYGVVAPPTILFFDTKGNEIKSARIVGETGPKEFLRRIPF